MTKGMVASPQICFLSAKGETALSAAVERSAACFRAEHARNAK